jgi:DNA-binding transcriptional MerR regulator
METKKLTSKQVSAEFNISINTLRRWRCEKIGPDYHKLNVHPDNPKSGIVLYDRSDLEEFFNKGVVKCQTIKQHHQ